MGCAVSDGYLKTGLVRSGGRDGAGGAVVATALLDRLLHHAVVIPIEGNSYRLRKRAALIPDHLRGRPLPIDPAASTVKRRQGRPPKEVPDSLPG